MSYSKYYLWKKQVSYDSGVTWQDVTPLETAPSGDPIGTYATLEECEEIIPLSAQYLTFIASDDITVTFTPENSNVLYYSKNSGSTWTQGNTIAMDAGDEVMFKGNMTPNSNGIGKFSSNGSFEALGNPMSLLFGDNFSDQTSLSGKNNAFAYLFQDCTYLQSIGNLVLPATTLATGCYQGMFGYCSSLTTIPSGLLPATTLAHSCYHSMFFFCSSLTTVPTDLLPATTLSICCYQFMFKSCMALASIPSGFLPATTLALGCYNQMFAYCTSLTTVPNGLLPATTLAHSCYSAMFENCTSLSSIPSGLLLATTLADYCYHGMFGYCSSLTTAPTLSATTLVANCYRQMFYNCTNLNSITCLATDISASDCTLGWLAFTAASGTFTKAASMSSWGSGSNGIPDGWTVQDAS